MTDAELAEIEAQHTSTDCDLPICWECSENYPCPMVRLVAEVRRLRAGLPTTGAEGDGRGEGDDGRTTTQ